MFRRIALSYLVPSLFLVFLGCGKVEVVDPAKSNPAASESSVAVTSVAEVASAAAGATASPATSQQARAVLDLEKLPLFDKAENPEQHLAAVHYAAPGELRKVAEFHLQQFKNLGWKELPPVTVTDQYASAAFTKNGYVVSFSAFPQGSKVSVSITNHGNVAPASLPVPPGTKPLYSGPQAAMHLAESSQEETQAAVRKLLIAAGWLPYGEAGDALFFRQNAVRLTASISLAPAQENKPVISYSTVLVRRELPVPTENVEQVSYSDQPLQVGFDAQMSEEEVVAYYKEELTPSGWTPTTAQANKIDFEKFLIFLDESKDLMEIKLRDLGEGKTRVLLRFQTAAEVAAEEARLKEALAKKRANENKPLPKLSITLPAMAKNVQADKAIIEFTLAAGTAQDSVATIREALRTAGWKEEVTINEALAGAATFSKDGQSISLSYTDPGFIPAEVELRAIGVELEAAP